MRNPINFLIVLLAIMTTNSANSTSVFPNLPSINHTSPTTDDFIIADISGHYSTPGFELNGSPAVDISVGGINIVFDVSSPAGPQPFVLEPFSYSIDIGQLSAGDWYLTPIFYVDGVFDAQLTTLQPLFTVSSVPVPATAWVFGSGLIGLIGIARRKKA